MFTFEPLHEGSQLPEVGQVGEHQQLDLKGPPPTGQAWNAYESAKDVAAFANGLGGTLLVGVHEDTSRGTVGKYSVFSPTEANRVTRAYEDAILDR